MAKVLHYGVDFIFKDPVICLHENKNNGFEYLAKSEPIYILPSNTWSIDTINGEHVEINQESLKGILWKAITE